MSLGALAVPAAVCAAAATLAACGGNPAPATDDAVTLSISRGFGATQLSPRQALPLSDSPTVMRQLKADHDVGTTFRGRVVKSIDGVSQDREGRENETAWVVYVNGFDADLLPPDLELHAGDVVHWDLRDWDPSMSVRATVGAFPKTFTQGMYGKRFPVTVECDRPASGACQRVKGALRRAGVPPDGSSPAEAKSSSGQPRQGRVLVGRWESWRDRPLLRHIDRGPRESSIFARIPRDGKTIDLFDWNGRRVETVGAGSGLVAATLPVEEKLFWLVTGVDDEGVDRAARALNATDLRDAFAVVATRDGFERVPRPPLPKAADDPNSGARYGVEGTPPSPASERREAAVHAPLVMLDRGEPWSPTAVATLMRRSALWWADEPRCGSEKVAVGRSLRGQQTAAVDWIYTWGLGYGPAYWRLPSDRRCELVHDARSHANEVTRPHERVYRPLTLPSAEGFYLDFDDRWLRRIRGENRPRPAPVYVERRRERSEHGPVVRLSYWMLFPMHDPAKGWAGPSHEGDWERVDVLLGGEEGGHRPIALELYDADGARRAVPWSDVARASDQAVGAEGSQRPMLSATRGAHSLSTRACHDCRPWRTWEQIVIARNQPWYGYGGAWGAAGPTSSTTGPLGPRGRALLPPR
jgi:hypothetical protein